MSLRSIMERVGKAERSERRPPIPLGRHLLEVDCLKMFESKRSAVTWFLFESTMVESDQISTRRGSKHSWIQDMTEEWSYGNLKNLFSALLPDASEEQLESPDVLMALIDEDKNPAQGEKVWVTVESRESKRNPGQMYKYYIWEPYQPAKAEE